MNPYRVLEIKMSVFEDNDRDADLLRDELKKGKTFLLNLMSSPGSGKTTTMIRTIKALKDGMTTAILEAVKEREKNESGYKGYTDLCET